MENLAFMKQSRIISWDEICFLKGVMEKCVEVLNIEEKPHSQGFWARD